ncbi:hypothetical protein GIB67_036188 [Kingdonia uniflora]|uniref:Uncharacterized protein n=1 Tax=Kingdonia uniflora TaxID=39325 RepID=A0A7J7NA18_9MAGN|nr:hypothetical protein GIB67_036188 [Kingdonia uniflora]
MMECLRLRSVGFSFSNLRNMLLQKKGEKLVEDDIGQADDEQSDGDSDNDGLSDVDTNLANSKTPISSPQDATFKCPTPHGLLQSNDGFTVVQRKTKRNCNRRDYSKMAAKVATRHETPLKYLNGGTKQLTCVECPRKYASISSLKLPNGTTTDKMDLIHNAALGNYKTLLTTSPVSDDDVLLNCIPNLVTLSDNDMVLASPTLDEIHARIHSIPLDSAPRLGAKMGYLVSRSPTEDSMIVKPKQLVFDDDEDCNLNDTLMAARKADATEESKRTWFRGKKDGNIEERFSFMVEFNESKVENPEQVEESAIDVLETQEVVIGVSESIVAKLREEIKRLEKENKVQKDQLTTKDEEKERRQ